MAVTFRWMDPGPSETHGQDFKDKTILSIRISSHCNSRGDYWNELQHWFFKSSIQTKVAC